MEIILNLIVIGIFWVFVVDYCGFVEEMERYLGVFSRSKAPKKIPKPFSCSLCMTWWTGLIYLLIIKELSFINLLFLVINCSFTKIYLHSIYTVRDFIDRVIYLFDRLTGID